MSNTLASRRSPLSIFNACRQCLSSTAPLRRTFASTTTRHAEGPSALESLSRQPMKKPPLRPEVRELGLMSIFGSRDRSSSSPTSNNPFASDSAAIEDIIAGPTSAATVANDPAKTHHFHIYSTKHNTHITLSTPDRSSLISLSAGNIGFRKAARGTYDAAYQLASYVLGRIQEEGLLRKIQRLEVVLRGFGIGREAVTKALLGTEGRLLRGKIGTVSDATRLKFGGTRSRKPRRLG